MAAGKDKSLVVQGQLFNETSIAAPSSTVFEYLAETHTLVSQVPLADRIVVAADKQHCQVFLTVRGLGRSLKITLPIEGDQATSRELGLVKIVPSAQPLLKPEPETLVGLFNAVLRVVPQGEATTRILSRIQVGVDLSPLRWVYLVPRPVITGAVRLIFQQRMELIFEEHLRRLHNYFPRWLELRGNLPLTSSL